MIFFNRKTFMFFTLPLMASFYLTVHAEEEKNHEPAPVDFQKVSEAFGHLIGKHIDSLGFEFDLSHVIKGISDAVSGKESPLSEAECIQKVSEVQEQAFMRKAATNLEEAEKFMEANAKEKDIVVMEKNKLHYKVNKQGDGAAVEEHFSPTISYIGKYLDGKEFSPKEEGLISLDDMIPGFSKGIIGMKEGESRRLYIHPDLGYGTNECLPPNSLLIFDVEIIKANNSQNNTDAPSSFLNEDVEAEVADIASPKTVEDSKTTR